MTDLTTTYLGLQLKNPLIAASSGLTETLEDILEFEKSGVGAIVIKSVFEEEIRIKLEKDMSQMNRASYMYPETMDYYDNYAQDDSLTNHLKLIRDAKKNVNIPVIASINCVTAEKWMYYAELIEEAGADAIELNMFILPSDMNRTAEENEKVYFDAVKEVMKMVKIPVSLKISYYSSNLANHIKNLSETGISGLVLFNRFYSPDIDIEKEESIATNVFSTEDELPISLRWIAMMSGRVSCDLAASTGVHSGEALVKQILGGANAVQVASAFYKNGKEYAKDMLNGLTKYMEMKGYKSINDFRGKLSQKKIENPAVYERVQFMKHFAGKD